MSWRPPTAKDGLAPAAGNPLIRCGCGRENNADLMLDIRRLPATARTALGIGGAGDFVCPPCVHLAELTGQIFRSDLARGLGAPPDHVERLVAHEQAVRIRFPAPTKDR